MYGEGNNAFARLQEEVEKKPQESSRQEDLLLKLPIVQQAAFNSLENQHAATCLPETRVELLEEIKGWIDGPDQRCIFWLNGIAGMGKSTVARTIARIYHDRGYLGASFFFSRGGGDVSCADRLFITLAWQLATKIPQTREYICKAIMKQENIAAQSLRDQWDHLILNPLLKLGSNASPSTIVLVIDALDECHSERDIRIILRLLALTSSLKAIRLRILMTSRPEISVRFGFSQIPEAERQLFVLHDISPAIVDRDLEIFFEDNFRTIREERGFADDWPGMMNVKRLVGISSGLFIWASIACRYIREGRKLAMKRMLDLINGYVSGGGPEKQLDELYTTVLRNSIQQGYSHGEKELVCGRFREVLGSIVILFSPLSMKSLSQILPLSSSDITDTLADLHAIINIPTEMERPIRLHHPTFRDFLLDRDRCSDLDLWVDEKQAHKAMADNFVNLMSRSLKRDICGLKSPGTLAKDIDPTLMREHISPELEYACRFWVQHYRESGTLRRDGDLAHLFIEDHFLYWLELMSVTGNGSEVAATSKFTSVSFIQDARRFIFAFLSMIELAPLQTYCAALAFSAAENELRHHFWGQMQHWIQDVRIAEAVSEKAQRPKTTRTFFVNDIAFTPDGRHLASGSVDEVVRLWDVATKARFGTLEGQTNKVSSIAISRDGAFIASGSDDTTIMVWDLRTGAVQHTLRGHTRWVNSVAFSPDGNLLASGSMDETIRIWGGKKGQEICILHGNSSCVNSVAFSPDSSLIASSSADQMIRIWDIKQREFLLLDGHSGAVNCARFSPSGQQIVSGGDDTTVRLWDRNTGLEYKMLKGHQGRVMTVAFSPDARYIASGSEDMTVMLWDAIGGSMLGAFKGHTSGINAITFSPDSRTVASSSFNEELWLWSSSTGEKLGEFDEFGDDDIPSLREKKKALRLKSKEAAAKKLIGHSSQVNCLVFSSDDQLVASGSHDSTVKIWTREGVPRWKFEGHSDSISLLTFSPDAHLLASASADKTAKVWSTETGALCSTLQDHSHSISLLRFSSDGRLLASCSADKTVILWDVGTGRLMHKLEDHSDTVNDVRFLPGNDRIIASCSADSTIKLWEVSTGKVTQTLRGRSDTVNSITFSSDGELLVSCSADSTIRLWDIIGNARGAFIGHTLPVNSAAISPDKKLVVSCSDDQTVRIWDLETKQASWMLKLEVSVRTVCFSSCGRYIETDRGVLDIDRVPPPIPLDRASTFFVSKDWLHRGGEKALWLPQEYHANCVAIRASTVVLGHATGGISFVYF